MRTFLTLHGCAVAREPTLIREAAFPQYVHWFEDSYARVATGLHYPPHRVAQRVLHPALAAAARDAARQPGRSAFLLAGGNANFIGLTPRKLRPQGPFEYTFRLLPLSLTNVYAARVAQDLGYTGHVSTDATACASASKSLMDALGLIRLHGYERVAILAVEDQVNTVMLEFFGETRACLTLEEMERDGVRPSAFDPLNRGFFIGQGAAFALLETEASMRAGGREPLCELLAATVVSEAHGNALGQRDDGAGFRDAIEIALGAAGVDAASIDLIKTHGTGTKSNNTAEAAGIESVFRGDFAATSYKAHIGHTMGPSGLIELLLALEDAGAGLARGIANRTGGDPRYLMQDRPMEIRRLLALSAGMGNVFGAAVCARP